MYSQRQLFLTHCAQTSPAPIGLEIVQAKGMYLKDIHNKRYMDMISGISVSALGHAHPEIVRAVQKQAKTYMHLMVYGEYVQHPQVKAAKALTDMLPESLNAVYFTNSGSEAVEAAIKLAKRVTGRHELIAMENAYHGSTQGALSLMGNPYFRDAYRPLLPGITHIRFNNYDDLKQINTRIAAVFCETIQGEAGAILPQKEWLQALRKKCTETGALLALDEIQCGMGRTGKFMAFEHYEIIPDILLLAKGLGGGMPIGALIADKSLLDTFTHNPVLGHITTFGGHPVSCAATYACVKHIKKNQLWHKATEIETIFRNELQHASIKGISGKGLLLAIEFENYEKNIEIIRQCIDNGYITDWFLFNDRSLRLAPPLVITSKQALQFCKKLIHILGKLSS